MNILVFFTVFELGHSLTREQFWKTLDARDICTLDNTGSRNIPASSLIDSVLVGLMEDVPVVSYDAVSGTVTLHDRTSIHTTQQALYAHDTDNIVPKDCTDVNSINCSGVYQVTPAPGVSIDVYCDMDTAGGPWTVIQNRQNGDVDFYRNWTEYKAGFGDLLGNFWLGNDNIHMLTSSLSTLRIELEAWNGTVGYAEYSEFQIGNEADNYRIHVQDFSGNTRNSMTTLNTMQFSTYDRDNDERLNNCAEIRHGAWWYRSCSPSNLNGGYQEDNGDNIQSFSWKKFFPDRIHVPMKKARMLVTKTP